MNNPHNREPAAPSIGEERYRALAELLPHIVIQVDAEGTVVYMNDQWREYTGVEDSNHLEARRKVIHPDDLESIDRLRNSGTSYETEARIRRADGVYRWHLIRARAIEETASLPAGRVVTIIDIDDRKRSEAALRFLSRAGDVLSRSLGLQETLEGLLNLVVPQLGDWATTNVRESDGRIHTLAARHANPAKAGLAERLRGAYYHNEDASIGTASVYRTKRSATIFPLTEAVVAQTVRPEYARVFNEFGLGSFVSVPILVEGEVIGTFGIGRNSAQSPFAQEEVVELEALAARAAFAIANAQVYEREHSVAQSFQKAALPASLPAVDGIKIDSFYQPALNDTIVGGDWYDAFALPDGRLVVSIGDVSGHGLAAAVKMSAVRQIIRGIAQIHPDPLTMLEAADRAIRGESEVRMVTAFAGVIDPAQGMTMTYASAGHVPAIVRRPTGVMDELRTAGLPLGYRHLSPTSSDRTVLERGSSLVLFTDGLVEFARDIRAGEAAVKAAVHDLDWVGCVAPAKEICGVVLGGATTGDDVAVLTFCVLE